LEEELDQEAVFRRFYSSSTVNTLPGRLIRVWRLQNRTSNSHCEICKWPCAAGWGRNGTAGHDW